MFAGLASGDRRRLQPGVIEKVTVTRDDRFDARCPGKRDEVVIFGVAQHGLWALWIGEVDRALGDAGQDVRSSALIDPLSEMLARQSARDLIEEVRADHGLELRLDERRENQGRCSLWPAGDAREQGARVDEKSSHLSTALVHRSDTERYRVLVI